MGSRPVSRLLPPIAVDLPSGGLGRAGPSDSNGISSPKSSEGLWRVRGGIAGAETGETALGGGEPREARSSGEARASRQPE